MSGTLRAVPIVLALAGLGCAPEVPANPTYTNDVKAILDAHCVRCHGAGDMLNMISSGAGAGPPSACYLQRYEDEGDCSNIANPDCKLGAGSAFCRGMIPGFVARTNAGRMPPPPSDPLTEWELQTILRWAVNQWPQ